MFISITRKLFFIPFLFLTPYVGAQKRIGIDLSAGVRKSFTNNVEKYYSTEPAFVNIYYYSRKRFDNPYFNLIANANYPVATNLKIGIQAGINVHYLENSPIIYGVRRTTLRPSVQLIQRYTLLKSKKSDIGIEAAEGFIFFSQDDYQIKFKNGALYNIAFFYSKNKASILKIGVEKQVDYVIENLKLISNYSPQDEFRYKLNRLAFSISYGVIIR